MYDVAIVGSGIAAISAALTLNNHNKKIIWFGSKELSSKIESAEHIKNYPAFVGVSGKNFVQILKDQIEENGLEITQKTVTGIFDMGKYYSILCNQDMFDAKSVIIATGVQSVKSIENEDKFIGRGLSYCATCDGFLYKGKTIAVICTSKALEHEIGFLADFASKAYLIPLYKNVEIKRDNIEILPPQVPLRVDGEKRVEKLVLKDGELIIDGLFILMESVSPSVLLRGLEMDGAHVKTNRDMSTNKKGVFACGDVTGRPYQYAKAAGEGNVAAHSAIEYLAQRLKD